MITINFKHMKIFANWYTDFFLYNNVDANIIKCLKSS